MDLLGHELQKMLLSKLGAHTLLFCGPERVGRRRVAHWYAALLNCDGAENEPCGHCKSCLAFLDDRHPDYREVAPATSTSTGRTSRKPQITIGQLVPRETGDKTSEVPLSRWLESRPAYKRRVAVIDHAESLGEAAGNAFLKILEEPPSYATIILIAPSVDEVLPTIASRSVVLGFGTVRRAELDIDHPAASLGRIGDLITARASEDSFTDLGRQLDRYLSALAGTLEEALEHADGLEKVWYSQDFSVPELLRAKLSRADAAGAPKRLLALERCEKALESYASPQLAITVLTLELRALGFVPSART